MPQNHCPICSQPADKVCSACKSVSYCSVEHQRQHWKKGHKNSCRPYLIKRNDIMGRYIVASRDISPGTIIMDEPALIIGPKQDTLPLCLGCHKRMQIPEEASKSNEPYYSCRKCSLPLCNEECEAAPIHSQYECSIFRRGKPIRISDYSIHHPIYQCILALRCLLLKDLDPKRWDKLQTMEHHNQLRQNITELWKRNEVNVVQFLRNVYKLPFESELIHTVLGYADINAFEIKVNGSEICGLFPEVALMAHECISNTHHSLTDDHRMIIRASVPIKKDDLITTTYTYTMEGTLIRRAHILASKLFHCCCPLCSSPNELGTYFSAIKCPNCSQGYLLPRDSLDADSIWECPGTGNKCHEMNANEIESIVTRIQSEIEEAEKMKDGSNIYRLESILQKYSGVQFHPQHFLMVGIWYSLSQFYGRMKGFTAPELDLQQLLRKEELCRSLLKVLDVIEPGYSRIRGSTLYELHAALLFLGQKRFKNNELNKEQLESLLNEVIEILKSSMIILGFDSPTSNTGRIAASIPDSIQGVKEVLRHFCHSSDSSNGTSRP